MRHVRTFLAETTTRKAFDALLRDVQISFQQRNSNTKRLTWYAISFITHTLDHNTLSLLGRISLCTLMRVNASTQT